MPETRAATGKNDCPVECGRIRGKNHLMCRACWGYVPPDLQDAVYETWRNWRNRLSDADLMHAYTHATEAAVAHVKDLREKRKR